jgi:hypothetical protein
MSNEKHDEEEDTNTGITYRLGGVIDATQVPGWSRRSPKWKKLINDILALEPRKSLIVIFDNKKSAISARNTIRDAINLRMGVAAIRTRVVQDPAQGYLTYFTKLPDEMIEHSDGVDAAEPETKQE